MTSPQMIIFDYGSVLVGPLNQEKFDRTLASLAHEHGFEKGIELWYHIYISEAWEQAKRGHISHQAFWADRLATLGLETEEARTAFKRRLYRHWGLFPQMRDLLYALHDADYRLAVLSNTSRKGFRQYLEEQRGLTGLFEVVISSAEVGYAKPEPQIYQITLAQANVPAEATLFIDDQERNTSAAEEHGIPSIVFTGYPALQRDLRMRGIIS